MEPRSLPTAEGPAWMSWLGVAAILLGVLFTAYEANEWMRQGVLDFATPANLEFAPPDCRADELEEEGLTLAECRQMVETVRSYVVSRPEWFSAVQSWLTAFGTLLALASVICGASLANYRPRAARYGAAIFALLAVVDAGQFIAAQQAGPILRDMHLPMALQWFSIHLAAAIAFFVAARQSLQSVPVDKSPKVYARFEVVSHWFLVVSVFFLFVSSWWMLALPLPSDEYRFREFPFQLHKNLGITILLLMIAMALIRVVRRQSTGAARLETQAMQKLRLAGHVTLYVLVFAVCVTGYMSSSYSGWSTTWWWLIELPYWGHENEELNQLYSDLHLWSCWGLLLAMAAHVGAALLHAVRNDGVVRRIVRW
jgi:cytochrome b561